MSARPVDVERAARRAREALLSELAGLDGRSPMAATILLAASGRGVDVSTHAERLLAFWSSRDPGSMVSESRYHWELSHERAPDSAYCPPRAAWRAFRPRDQAVLERDPAAFEQRFTVPISVCDGGALLAARAREGDEVAARLLRHAEPVIRKDLAAYVRGAHAWTDTFALECLVRRPRLLARMQPFAIAIAACHTPDARAHGHVRGARFPFHEQPLVSASAFLASGLLALGLELPLVAELAAFVATAREPRGGWGDAAEPPDVLTTWAAASLLARVDPDFDARAVAAWLAARQTPQGLFRALGPETPWLTDVITSLLEESGRPFAERFRWPYLPDDNRDHKTRLPFYAYFTQLATMFEDLPGLARSTCRVAFMDLCGFREFNNRFGQDMGDDVLRAFADTLGEVGSAIAIRDGGDEFLLVGAPTFDGLPEAVERFRDRWPARFVERFGADAPVVRARVLVGECRGDRLVAAREVLGRAVGDLKHSEVTDDPRGARRDLGAIA